MVIKAKIQNKSNAVVVDRSYRNLSFNYVYEITKTNTSQILMDDVQYLYNIRSFYSDQVDFAIIPYTDMSSSPYHFYNCFLFTQPTQIYVFSDKDIAPKTGPKLVIRNDLGIPIFCSDMKPMRVVRHITGEIADLGSDYVVFNEVIEAGRKYAVAPCDMPFRLWKYADRGYEVGIHTLFFTTNSATGQVTIKYGKAYSEWGGPPLGKSWVDVGKRYSVLILDVTDY
ncbi:hypothetical protein SLJ62_08845 [Acinetobacter pittii]|uniref:hypothetical protein n=1 Tax=Acinetobacter pittii TaxID=48296 RepID=UPI001980E383|nr:hypothetical protein [Acinetobacter pittii]MBN6517055.1 hypothetical protein [Acinetobacter pittii]MDX8155666.1 hypothetical protein [Acinetobacter pittii]